MSPLAAITGSIFSRNGGLLKLSLTAFTVKFFTVTPPFPSFTETVMTELPAPLALSTSTASVAFGTMLVAVIDTVAILRISTG